MMQVREKVRFVETDLMGVAHHSNYLRWFEMARVEYLRAAGISLLDLFAEDIVFPIVSVECKYMASARFDDWLLIDGVLLDCHRAKMDFGYQVRRESDGAVLSEGYSRNVFTTGSGKMVRLPDEYFERLAESFQNDKDLPAWAAKWKTK